MIAIVQKNRLGETFKIPQTEVMQKLKLHATTCHIGISFQSIWSLECRLNLCMRLFSFIFRSLQRLHIACNQFSSVRQPYHLRLWF